MGFGQYTQKESQKDRGYPDASKARANARTSYIRKSEQLSHETSDVVWSRKRGKADTIYVTEDGRIVWVLYDTPIVTVNVPDGTVTLDTGGWHTMTTRRGMMDALSEIFNTRYGFRVFGDKRNEDGRNGVKTPTMDSWDEAIRFDRSVTLSLDLFGEIAEEFQARMEE